MLRVLACEVLAFATLHGAAQLSFRGYRVAARRLCATGANEALVKITLACSCGGEPLDRVRIAVAFRSDAGSAWRIDSLHAPKTAVCTTESLAGCVSPVDARYASPETGQIS
ncbi:MAG: hypothetical protein QY320_06795 [Gammaproteobacteria bacterium]|nr:MAG: hypothetical protein QY320_06795 [Gammaproteobacteria bacterium]